MADKKTDDGVKATDKHKRTTAARGNGGEDNPGIMTGETTIGKPVSEFLTNASARPTDNGDREAVSPADLDRVYTADSKDRWDTDQPSLQDQIKALRKSEAQSQE